jgi:predicted nucleotidyltransferase
MSGMNPLRDRVEQKRNQIMAIAARYGATNVRLFGSVARGDARSDSDVDLLVDLIRPWSLLDHIAMQQDLEDLLGCRVDLIVASALRTHVRESALEQAIPL